MDIRGRMDKELAAYIAHICKLPPDALKRLGEAASRYVYYREEMDRLTSELEFVRPVLNPPVEKQPGRKVRKPSSSYR